MTIQRPNLSGICYEENRDKESIGRDYEPNYVWNYFTADNANEIKHIVNSNNAEISGIVDSVEQEFENRDNEIADILLSLNSIAAQLNMTANESPRTAMQSGTRSIRNVRPTASITIESAPRSIECSFGEPISYDGMECPNELRIYAAASNGNEVTASIDGSDFNLCVIEKTDEFDRKYFILETIKDTDDNYLPFMPASSDDAGDFIIVKLTADGCAQYDLTIDLSISRPIMMVTVDRTRLDPNSHLFTVDRRVEYEDEDVDVSIITARTGFSDSRLTFVYPTTGISGVSFKKSADGKTLTIKKKNDVSGTEEFSVFIKDLNHYCKQVEIQYKLTYSIIR